MLFWSRWFALIAMWMDGALAVLPEPTRVPDRQQYLPVAQAGV